MAEIYVEKTYDENGNLESEMPYNIGKLHGIARSYYKNGNLKTDDM